MHGCRFCYVDGIHKRFGERTIGKAVYKPWGDYFFVPRNMKEAMQKTNWSR